MTGVARRILFCFLSSGCLLLAALQATFHMAARLVQINVIVRDKNGPVAHLEKDDFAVTDQGKPRTISVFAVNSVAEQRAQPLPANTFSNFAGEPPSVTMILLDRLNTLTGSGGQNYEENPGWSEELAIANAKQHLIRFISTLEPKDRVAIYSLGRSLDVLSDFSSDRARLLEILNEYKPVSLTRREDIDPLPIHTPVPGDFNETVDQERQRMAAMANTNRAETTLAALSAIAAHAAGISGRKNLVWLASNLSISPAAAAQVVSRANIAIYPVDARGLLPQAAPHNEEASHIVFGGRDGGWSRQGSQPPGLQTMIDVATATGGRAFLRNNDLAGAIRTAVNDAAITYTLGFYIDELDDKFHELKIRVKKGSYEVRHPRGYYALRGDPAVESPLLNAIITPLESSAIGLTARVDRNGADSMTVTGVIDLGGLDLSQEKNLHTGVAQVYVVQQDLSGKVLDHAEERLNLRLNEELYAKYLKTGILFRETIKRQSGLATLRVLVASRGGSRAGSLIIPASQLP